MSSPTGKPIRLRDLANSLKLSVSTVSMAMSGNEAISPATRARVEHAAERMGYVPQRRTRRAERTVVGFWAFATHAEEEGNAALTFRLSEEAEKKRKRLEVRSFPQVPSLPQLRILLDDDEAPEELIVTGRIPHAHLSAIAEKRARSCLLGHPPMEEDGSSQAPFPCVSWQEEEIGATAARILLARGFRRIGCFCQKLYPAMSQARFVNGYRLALFDAGIAPDRSWVLEGGLQYADGEKALDQTLRRKNAPEAFIAPRASTMAWFRAALERRQRTLEENAIVFWDVDGNAGIHGLAGSSRIESELSQMARFAFHIIAEPSAFAGPVMVSMPFHVKP